jgi:hypothetical protein
MQLSGLLYGSKLLHFVGFPVPRGARARGHRGRDQDLDRPPWHDLFEADLQGRDRHASSAVGRYVVRVSPHRYQWLDRASKGRNEARLEAVRGNERTQRLHLARPPLAAPDRERACEVDHRLAEQEGVTDAYVCRLLPLTCLAPDIVEAILDGRQLKGAETGRGVEGRWPGRDVWGFSENLRRKLSLLSSRRIPEQGRFAGSSTGSATAPLLSAVQWWRGDILESRQDPHV